MEDKSSMEEKNSINEKDSIEVKNSIEERNSAEDSMEEAVGLLEVYGLVCAFLAADAGCKAADVRLEIFDKNKPANAESLPVPLLVTVKFRAALRQWKQPWKRESEKQNPSPAWCSATSSPGLPGTPGKC